MNFKENAKARNTLRKNQVVTALFLDHFIVNPSDEHWSARSSFLPLLEDFSLKIWPLDSPGRQALQHLLAARSNGLRRFNLVVKEVKTRSEVSEYESLRCFSGAGIRMDISCHLVS